MKITIEVTPDELNMIRYALREMGGRRAEQAIDLNIESSQIEAENNFRLADMFCEPSQLETRI